MSMLQTMKTIRLSLPIVDLYIFPMTCFVPLPTFVELISCYLDSLFTVVATLYRYVFAGEDQSQHGASFVVRDEIFNIQHPLSKSYSETSESACLMMLV